jgi:hypothetical protein
MLEKLDSFKWWESPGEILGLSIYLGYILFVWFNTNVFVEYVQLFKLKQFFYVDQYKDLVDNGYASSYLDFLKEYFYDLFLVRLVSCPICLGFWLGLLAALIFGASPLIIPLGLCFYGFFNKLV